MAGTHRAARPTRGDFVEIPAQRTSGLVLDVALATAAPEGALRVMLQEYPEQRIATCRSFTVQPGEYTIV